MISKELIVLFGITHSPFEKERIRLLDLWVPVKNSLHVSNFTSRLDSRSTCRFHFWEVVEVLRTLHGGGATLILVPSSENDDFIFIRTSESFRRHHVVDIIGKCLGNATSRVRTENDGDDAFDGDVRTGRVRTTVGSF